MTFPLCSTELPTVAVSDTTSDDSSNEDGYIIINQALKKLIEIKNERPKL